MCLGTDTQTPAICYTASMAHQPSCYTASMAHQNFILLNWNVIGLNGQIRREAVRDMIRTAKPTIVCLQETKLQLISDEIIVQTLGTQFKEHYSFMQMV